MGLTRKEYRQLLRGIDALRDIVYIRTDTYNALIEQCKQDFNLLRIISYTIDGSEFFARRIKESNVQGNAGLSFDIFGQKRTGKSWAGYEIIRRILRSRHIRFEEARENIIFKVEEDIINRPSLFTKGIAELANKMEHKHDGYRFGLLQDEADPEHGAGTRKQIENQNSAVDNLRKLGVVTGFCHVHKEDLNFNFEFRLLSLGTNDKLGIWVGVLYFTSAVGLIVLKIPKPVREFLEQQYNEDAVESVWKKAKTGFHTNAIDPDAAEEDEFDKDDTKVIRGVFNTDNFTTLRNLLKKYYNRKKDFSEPFSRIATSFYLWSHQWYYANSKKAIDPATFELTKMPLKEAAKDWVDEVSVQSLYQASSKDRDKYGWRVRELEGKSHDLESIGEEYCSIVLQHLLSQITEHLNPPVAAAVRTQYGGSSFLQEGGKPYDVVLLTDGTDALAINHKIHTSNKRYGSLETDEGQAIFDKSFGISPHPFSLLWMTYTRPFREVLYIKLNPDLVDTKDHLVISRNSRTAKVMDILAAHTGYALDDSKLVYAHEQDQLGAVWTEIDFEVLEKILEVLVS